MTDEIREGALTYGAQITAPSIERALELAGGGKPGHEVRLVFPIGQEAFFVPEGSDDLAESVAELGAIREQVRQLQPNAERRPRTGERSWVIHGMAS